MAERIKGLASLRRTLRTLPEDVREEVADALLLAGQRMLVRARAETPVKTGKLRSLLKLRVAARTLNLRLGLVTKGDQRRGFYGYILDAGRRAKTVTARRKGGAPYRFRVRAISSGRYDFVFGRRKDFLTRELPLFSDAVERALRRAANG